MNLNVEVLSVISKNSHYLLPLILGFVILSCLPEKRNTQLMSVILQDTTGHFRGLSLKNPHSHFDKTENKNNQIISDSLGVIFRYILAPHQSYDVEYYLDKANRIVGIVCNVQLESEVLTKDTYQELVSFYQKKYNRNPTGNFGDYAWIFDDHCLYLRMLPSKMAFSLNFTLSN